MTTKLVFFNDLTLGWSIINLLVESTKDQQNGYGRNFEKEEGKVDTLIF